MYSVHGNVCCYSFHAAYTTFEKTIRQLLMSSPVSAGRRGQTRVVWHFQHQSYKCNGGQKNLGQFEKLFQVNYKHRSLILLITFWPHLLPSNVASPPPSRKIIFTHFAQTSALFRGGEVPVLLIIIQRPKPFSPHCRVTFPWQKRPKKYTKKVNNTCNSR